MIDSSDDLCAALQVGAGAAEYGAVSLAVCRENRTGLYSVQVSVDIGVGIGGEGMEASVTSTKTLTCPIDVFLELYKK